MFINLVVIPFLYISFLKKKSKSRSRKPKYGDKDYVQPAEHYQPDFPEDQLPLDKDLQPWDYFNDDEKLCGYGDFTGNLIPITGEEREERIAGEKKLYARKKKEKRRQKAKEKIKQRETKDTVAAAHARLKAAEEELRQMLLEEKEENGEQREGQSS